MTLKPKSNPVDLRQCWKESNSTVKTSNKFPSGQDISDNISFKLDIFKLEISESINGY